MIQFKFYPLKTVQAAALLLNLHSKPMNYMAFLKLMYISDRLAMQFNDQPISGDRYLSINFGPVLSHVYNVIKGEGEEDFQETWDIFILRRASNYKSTRNYTITLVGHPGNDELSDQEENIIKGVYSLLWKSRPICFG